MAPTVCGKSPRNTRTSTRSTSSQGQRGLWDEPSVFLFWVEQGVTVFRVDNPRKAPLWEWVIDQISAATRR
jgi:hypothetical protein